MEGQYYYQVVLTCEILKWNEIKMIPKRAKVCKSFCHRGFPWLSSVQYFGTRQQIGSCVCCVVGSLVTSQSQRVNIVGPNLTLKDGPRVWRPHGRLHPRGSHRLAQGLPCWRRSSTLQFVKCSNSSISVVGWQTWRWRADNHDWWLCYVLACDELTVW